MGVEHIPQLCTMSEVNLRKDPVHRAMLENGTMKIIKSDGRLGYPEGGTGTIHSIKDSDADQYQAHTMPYTSEQLRKDSPKR